uniref:Uncharacterized protein n=1 Tax=Aegilops tauschii subsp. strangulata TaxID=200361 RepID=A0A453E2T1_AEGTS
MLERNSWTCHYATTQVKEHNWGLIGLISHPGPAFHAV